MASHSALKFLSRGTIMPNAECHYAKCYAECHYVKCYAECHYAVYYQLSVNIMSILMLTVAMLSLLIPTAVYCVLLC